MNSNNTGRKKGDRHRKTASTIADVQIERNGDYLTRNYKYCPDMCKRCVR